MTINTLNEIKPNEAESKKIQLNNGLDKDARMKIVNSLGNILADSYLLMLKTHNYHWNLRGELFYTIHNMTEEQYTEIFGAIDVIAERIRALGFKAPGTFEEFSRYSSIAEGDSSKSQVQMIVDLVESHEMMSKNCRKVLKIADKHDDDVTVDMLTERLTQHEKFAWMLRSILEK